MVFVIFVYTFAAMYDYESIFHEFRSGHLTYFYESLYPGLLVYASRQLGDELAYLAEDCVQDAVMSSYTKRSGFDNSRAWYAYILRTIFNQANNITRRNRARDNYLNAGNGDNDMIEPAFEASLIEQEILDRLYAAIENLPPRMRTILKMSYQDGLKNAEIAGRLGIAEITVKMQKARILATLREALGKDISSDMYLIMLIYAYFHSAQLALG